MSVRGSGAAVQTWPQARHWKASTPLKPLVHSSHLVLGDAHRGHAIGATSVGGGAMNGASVTYL